MKFPGTIKILGFDYKVCIVKNLSEAVVKHGIEVVEVKDCIGYCSFDTLTIFIEESQLQTMESVFIHEIIEAMNHHLALGLKHDNIDRLELAFFQFVKQNPGVCTWL